MNNPVQLLLVGRNGSEEKVEVSVSAASTHEPTQQHVFETIRNDERMPLGFEYRLNGAGTITYIADSDQLTVAVVDTVREVFRDALSPAS